MDDDGGFEDSLGGSSLSGSVDDLGDGMVVVDGVLGLLQLGISFIRFGGRSVGRLGHLVNILRKGSGGYEMRTQDERLGRGIYGRK